MLAAETCTQCGAPTANPDNDRCDTCIANYFANLAPSAGTELAADTSDVTERTFTAFDPYDIAELVLGETALGTCDPVTDTDGFTYDVDLFSSADASDDFVQ